ncbi:MAG: tRNA(Ile)-lysidine synthase [candidate division TM6 bacterium GW2011_GWF2_28_16]|nr:MAG: tRNA(Ile)-lysidine synthase [candidate division TM6 bacterium GW2011_GWF2_28_16]
MFEKLEQELKNIINLENKPKIILGLSGGPDSVYLFLFLNKLAQEDKIELICAHLNHEWRTEAIIDVEFCKNLCAKNNIKFIAGKASELEIAIKFNGSLEEIGRKLRRYFFNKILKQEDANYIALAHHLQDQQETFFWRIIRGTTLKGLSGMKMLQEAYIRPLLNIEKKDILDYLDKNNIKYLIDYTNYSDKYLRNRIRKYVLPALEKVDSRFSKKFLTTLNFLQEEEAFLNKITENNFNIIFKNINNKYTGNLTEFKKLDIILQKRILIYWLDKIKVKFTASNSFLLEILRFLNNPNGGKHKINQDFSIIKKQNNFMVL